MQAGAAKQPACFPSTPAIQPPASPSIPSAHLPLLQAHTFLHTGAVPAGWWQKAHKESPVKKAAAAAAGGGSSGSEPAPKPKPPKKERSEAAAEAGGEAAQPKKKRPVKEAAPEAAAPVVAAANGEAAAGVVQAAALDVPMQDAAAEAGLDPAAVAAAALNSLPGWVGGSGAAHSPRPAGSGSTSTRDMLRSVFNRIKLLHPAAARLETPNSVVDLLSGLRAHFGPALALTAEQLVRRGAGATHFVALWKGGSTGQPAVRADAAF